MLLSSAQRPFATTSALGSGEGPTGQLPMPSDPCSHLRQIPGSGPHTGSKLKNKATAEDLPEPGSREKEGHEDDGIAVAVPVRIQTVRR